MSVDLQKQLLEKYSDDRFLNTINQFSKEQKQELLTALGGKSFLQKEDKIVRDKSTIQHLCQTKLQTLLLLEKQQQNPVEKVDNSDYKNQYAIHKDKYINIISRGEIEDEILISKHVFEHVISDLSKYKSGSLAEKMKHARGLSPNFGAKNRQKQSYINKRYLSLDPEKIDISIIDFLKTGEVQKKKYTTAEELSLKQRFLNNHSDCKEILFGYESLIIPKNEGYSEIMTERIVKLKKEDKPIGYLVSENKPIRYTENHIRKYRGNEFSFEVFATKEQLLAYLKNELVFIKEQKKRFQKAIDYFTIMDPEAKNKDNIEPAYVSFSTHGTFTDQVITEKLDQLLSPNQRGHQQIIQSIIVQSQKGIEESKIKEQIMRDHYNAIVDNKLF